jgi:hypothetical protein
VNRVGLVDEKPREDCFSEEKEDKGEGDPKRREEKKHSIIWISSQRNRLACDIFIIIIINIGILDSRQ